MQVQRELFLWERGQHQLLMRLQLTRERRGSQLLARGPLLIFSDTNWSFVRGTLRRGGTLILETNSSSTISGTLQFDTKGVNEQLIINRGTVTASASATITTGASWINESGALYIASGGSLDDNGTAGYFLNKGTLQRTALVQGTVTDLLFTNAGGLISSQNGTLGLPRLVQTSGRTELRGGNLSGTMDLQGGILVGAGDVGDLVNRAEVYPGNAIGTIRSTGGSTNNSQGTVHLQLASPTSYDRLNVSGPMAFTNDIWRFFRHRYDEF